MEVLIWILLLVAVMWVFQLYMAVKQSQRFADALKEIRTPGTTTTHSLANRSTHTHKGRKENGRCSSPSSG